PPRPAGTRGRRAGPPLPPCPGPRAPAAGPPSRSRPGYARHKTTTSARPAAGTSRRSCSWPSPRQSLHTARLRVRPREEGRRFFQELVFHPQPRQLSFEFLHARTLHRRKRLVRLRMLAPPGVHPVPQGPIVDPQVPGHLRDRLTGLNHHLHGLSLELRAELAAMLWHEQILSVEPRVTVQDL